MLLGLFSSCGEWGGGGGGYPVIVVSWGFSVQVLILLQSTGSRVLGLSGCSSPALEHRLGSCCTWSLIAPKHVGSSWRRD